MAALNAAIDMMSLELVSGGVMFDTTLGELREQMDTYRYDTNNPPDKAVTYNDDGVGNMRGADWETGPEVETPNSVAESDWSERGYLEGDKISSNDYAGYDLGYGVRQDEFFPTADWQENPGAGVIDPDTFSTDNAPEFRDA